MSSRGAQAREIAASAAQYALLGGFASVAAGISAQGLTGFARDNMGLQGPWPYLLFFALDGAAGVCAVLLMRRAARAESSLAPRLAVWGLVAASAAFNWTHAPGRSAAPEAFGLMPVIAAMLFEFTLRELRLRTEGRADRKLTALRWLHPAERIRVQLRLAADDRLSAEAATRRVRVDQAARRLYLLRLALHTRAQAATPGAVTTRQIGRAERRAHAALTRARFTDPEVAAEVLRQVQVLTLTPALARLDYATADAARAAIGNLITHHTLGEPVPGPPARTAQPDGPANPREPDRPTAAGLNGHSAAPAAVIPSRPGQDASALPAGAPGPTPAGTSRSAVLQDAVPGDDSDRDGQLVAAATRILAEAAQDGSRLSQTALAEKLRGQGYSIANDRLRWLSAACGLEPRHG